jgi:hypothetical protein
MPRNTITDIQRDILLALLSNLIIRFLFPEFGDHTPTLPPSVTAFFIANFSGRGSLQ